MWAARCACLSRTLQTHPEDPYRTGGLLGSLTRKEVRFKADEYYRNRNFVFFVHDKEVELLSTFEGIAFFQRMSLFRVDGD